jgi:energy-coupling factor transporter transmembrane protein EcfT
MIRNAPHKWAHRTIVSIFMISVLFLVASIQSFRFQTLSVAMILSCVYIANVAVAKMAVTAKPLF